MAFSKERSCRRLILALTIVTGKKLNQPQKKSGPHSTRKRMARPAAFLDSSIFITALLSSKGGAFYILNALKDEIDLQTSEYALEEIEIVLQRKFSHMADMRTRLFLLLGTAGIAILQNQPKSEVMALKKYISEKDAPILASALKHSDYLLTLDNEFFNKSIIELANSRKLTILKPKGFIEKFAELD